MQMVASLLCFLTGFCFLSILPTGQAIKCFVCNSYFDNGCLDVGTGSDNSSGLLRDCDAEPIFPYGSLEDKYTICRKMTVSLPGQENRRIVRSCSWIKHKNDCYFTATLDVKSTVCQCYEEGCNSSNHLQATLMALFISLCIVLFTAR